MTTQVFHAVLSRIGSFPHDTATRRSVIVMLEGRTRIVLKYANCFVTPGGSPKDDPRAAAYSPGRLSRIVSVLISCRMIPALTRNSSAVLRTAVVKHPGSPTA